MDLRATPLDAALPGFEVHAQVLEHILSGRTLTRPDFAVAVEMLAMIVFGVFLAGVVQRLPALTRRCSVFSPSPFSSTADGLRTAGSVSCSTRRTRRWCSSFW
jgi:hypothetical protein